MTNPQLMVLTGGPGAGKTTVLKELQRRGYAVAPEVAREIIQREMARGGDALPWADRSRYTELMLQGSIGAFRAHTPSERPVLMDRGIPDVLAYARLAGLNGQDALMRICLEYRYCSAVVIAPPWREIYTTDTERKQTWAEAVETYHVLKGTYGDCGYEVLELPKQSPEQRADFIMETLLARPRL